MEKTEKPYFTFCNGKKEYSTDNYFLSKYTSIELHRLFFKMYGRTFIEGLLTTRNELWEKDDGL